MRIKQANSSGKVRRVIFPRLLRASFLNSLKSKLIIIFIILITVPVLSIAYISAAADSAELIAKAKESLTNATRQTANYYEIALKNIRLGYVKQIELDDRVIKWLMADNNEDIISATDKKNKANQLIQNIGSSYSDDIDRIIVVRNDSSAIGYMTIVNDSARVADTTLYKSIAASKDGIWLEELDNSIKNDNRDYVLSYGVPVINSSTGQASGVILVDIKSSAFSDILSSVYVGSNSLTYAVSKSGEVISNDKVSEEQLSLDSNSILNIAVNTANNESNGIFNEKLNGIEYIVSFSKSETTGWVFVTAVPENDVVATIKANQTKILFMGLLFIVAAVLVAVLFSLTLTRPIKKIMVVMREVEQGELYTKVPVKRKDELGLLAEGLNSMIEQIRVLIVKNRQISGEVNLSAEEIVKISGITSRISQEI